MIAIIYSQTAARGYTEGQNEKYLIELIKEAPLSRDCNFLVVMFMAENTVHFGEDILLPKKIQIEFYSKKLIHRLPNG